MRIVVKFHRQSEPSLAAWRDRVVARPPHDEKMPATLLAAMRQWFEAAEGFPPGTMFRGQNYPPHHVARFSTDTWVHFLVKSAAGGRTREVIVLELSPGPPT
ncbi:MAG: hypothetical protein ACRC7O_15340 [Fimbriiglobus sp.]